MLRVAFTMVLGMALASARAQQAFQRGLVALKENHLNQALEDFTKAEEENPDDARVHNFRGIALVKLGKLDAAAEEYRQSIRLDPAGPDAYRNLGYLEWTQQHLAEARQALEKALKLKTDDHYARYYLGRVELEQGHYRSGLKDLERARVPLHDDPDLLLEVAGGYLALRQEAHAQPLLVRLRGLPLDAGQSIRLGSLLLTAHESQEALSLFQHLADQHPGLYWSQFDLALANLKAGQLHEAVSLATSLSRTDKTAEPWALLGIAYSRLDEKQRAISAFRHAVALAPDQEGRWLDLTHELMDTGDSAGAIAAAQEGLAHNPRSYALHLRLGAACLQAGRYTQAEEVFRNLIAIGDPTPTSAIGLAQVLLRTGRAAEAVQALAQARQRLGASFLLVYFQGIAYSRVGQAQKAAEMFQEAVQLNPDSAEALQWLGAMELQLGETHKAIRHLQEAVRLNRGMTQARHLLARAYAIEHNPQLARRYLQEETYTTALKTRSLATTEYFYPSWKTPEKPSP